MREEESLLKVMLKHKIGRFECDLHRIKNPSEQNIRPVLVGHSAGGKSALLKELGLDRAACDMDVFVQRNKLERNLETFFEMVRREPDCPLYVVANDVSLLKELARARKNGGLDQFLFIYLKRPLARICEFLKVPNTDGLSHRAFSADEYELLYNAFNDKFEQIADCLIEYDGTEISELASGVNAILDMGKEVKRAPVVAQSTRQPQQASNLTSEQSAFREYYEIARAGTDPKLIGEAEMREITAGGYQVFDATKFPPVPNPKSICGQKLNDLRWTESDFQGRSALEIGCQLGFFTFTALAKGATEVVGFDLNPRFATEANKIAFNYKKNVCGWDEDRAKFATRRFAPGEDIGLKPDILITNSIVHWWVIQNPDKSIEEIMDWLRLSANYAVYFEGCVTAEEPIMQQNGVSVERFNESLFLDVCKGLFSDVEFIGRCSYDKRRIVARLYR